MDPPSHHLISGVDYQPSNLPGGKGEPTAVGSGWPGQRPGRCLVAILKLIIQYFRPLDLMKPEVATDVGKDNSVAKRNSGILP